MPLEPDEKVNTKLAKVKTKSQARPTTGRSENVQKLEADLKKPGSHAYITSSEWAPISDRTYVLETKRKGSTEGYKQIAGKYFKENIVASSVGPKTFRSK